MKTNAKVTSSWQLAELVLGDPTIRTTYLWGPPGTGKTYAAYHFGRVQKGYYAVTLTPETTMSELRGHYVMKGGDSPWHDGAFIRAMTEGKRLVLNEITNANGDVQALLFPILESFETARLYLPNGLTVVPAPGFHVVVTDNQPQEELSEPLQDRFMATLHVSAPHPNALADLDDDLRTVAEAGHKITDDRHISARGWRDLQQLSRTYGLRLACELRFGEERGGMLHDAIEMEIATSRRPRT